MTTPDRSGSATPPTNVCPLPRCLAVDGKIVSLVAGAGIVGAGVAAATLTATSLVPVSLGVVSTGAVLGGIFSCLRSGGGHRHAKYREEYRQGRERLLQRLDHLAGEMVRHDTNDSGAHTADQEKLTDLAAKLERNLKSDLHHLAFQLYWMDSKGTYHWKGSGFPTIDVIDEAVKLIKDINKCKAVISKLRTREEQPSNEEDETPLFAEMTAMENLKRQVIGLVKSLCDRIEDNSRCHTCENTSAMKTAERNAYLRFLSMTNLAEGIIRRNEHKTNLETENSELRENLIKTLNNNLTKTWDADEANFNKLNYKPPNTIMPKRNCDRTSALPRNKSIEKQAFRNMQDCLPYIADRSGTGFVSMIKSLIAECSHESELEDTLLEVKQKELDYNNNCRVSGKGVGFLYIDMNNEKHRSTEGHTPYLTFVKETMAHYKEVAEGKSANDVPPHEPMLEAKTHIWQAPDGIATNPEEDRLQEKRNAAYEKLYKVWHMCHTALNAGKTLIEQTSNIWWNEAVTPASILRAISSELEKEGYNQDDIKEFINDLQNKFFSNTDSNVEGAGATQDQRNAQLNELLETAVKEIRCCNEKKHEEAVALIRSGLARP